MAMLLVLSFRQVWEGNLLCYWNLWKAQSLMVQKGLLEAHFLMGANVE